MKEKKRSLPVAQVFITLIMVFGLIWCVVVYRSASFYDHGEIARKKGDLLSAITFYERSALYFAPANLYFADAIKRLEELKKTPGIFGKQAGQALDRLNGQIYPVSTGHRHGEAITGGGLSLIRRLAVQFFFITWIASAIWLFIKGFSADGGVIRGKAYAGLTVFAVSVSAWLYLLAL